MKPLNFEQIETDLNKSESPLTLLNTIEKRLDAMKRHL